MSLGQVSLLIVGSHSRFGIYLRDDAPEDPPLGRSLMSPRMNPREPTADARSFFSTWTEDESWQSYVFNGPTTQEVSIYFSMPIIVLKTAFHHLLTLNIPR